MASVSASQAGLAALRDHLIRAPHLQARLADYVRPDEYDAALLAVCDTLGIKATAADLRAAPLTLDHWPEPGWLPARAVPGATPAFDWAWFGTHPLTDPFFEETARRVSSRPFTQMFGARTSLDAMIASAADGATLVPAGFIFHMSRCGSTLVSNMLAAVPHHHVLSEAEPVDAVVQWASQSQAPLPDRIAAVRAIVAAFGRHRLGEARRFFLKLDSWHSLALPVFRAAFPDVPWLFLYREPSEVLVSHKRQPGIHTVYGGLPQSVLGIAGGEHLTMEAYAAMALSRVCGAVLEHAHLGGGMLVNYSALDLAMLDGLPRHFGFVPDARELAAMQAAKLHHSKHPQTRYVPDSRAKRATTSPAIDAAITTHLRDVYEALERRRSGAHTPAAG
jgi:hypothetical protein